MVDFNIIRNFSKGLFGGRLTVGQLVLVQSIGVRFPASEPNKITVPMYIEAVILFKAFSKYLNLFLCFCVLRQSRVFLYFISTSLLHQLSFQYLLPALYITASFFINIKHINCIQNINKQINHK